jgi:hypothetical protein
MINGDVTSSVSLPPSDRNHYELTEKSINSLLMNGFRDRRLVITNNTKRNPGLPID